MMMGQFGSGHGGGGFNIFNPETGKFKVFLHDPFDSNSISSEHIWEIFKDSRGEYWFASMKGITRYNKERDEFTRYLHDSSDPDSLSDNVVWTVLEDSRGQLWFGTDSNLERFDRKTERFFHYVHDPNKLGSISNNGVLSLLEDYQGNLWVGTEGGGLNKMDLDSETFTVISVADGLPSDVIYSIQLDHEDYLWACDALRFGEV